MLARSQVNRGKEIREETGAVAGPRMSFSGWEPKKLFLQRPDGGFEETAYADGFDSRADGRSLAAVDLDNDGDQDLVMINRDEPRVEIFRNRGPTGAALELQLHQPKDVTDGAGALVKVTANGRTNAYAAVLARGYQTAQPARIHAGLGDAATADVEVRWPDGTTQHFASLSKGKRWHLTKGEAQARAEPFADKKDHTPVRPPTTLEAIGVKPEARPTIVAFLSTTCEPCKKEMPRLNELAKTKARVIGVAADGPEIETAAKTKADLGAAFEVRPLTEELAQSMETMGAITLPVSIVYGPDGRWRRVVRTEAALEEAL